LRNGGRIAVIDFSEDGFFRGHATPAEEIRAQMEEAGYGLATRHEFLERQSFQIFVVRPDLRASEPAN
jgi:hypothetical protein